MIDADGLEMYEEVLHQPRPHGYIDQVGAVDRLDAGFAMPMLCCSPRLHPPRSRSARESAVDRQAAMIHITRRLRRRSSRLPRSSRASAIRGSRWPRGSPASCHASKHRSLSPVRRTSCSGLENHYKDGFWTYPEFAQKRDVFLALLDAIPDRDHFGVQFDPSNALVAGDDPVELLQLVADRVVSMHASDRYLADGATLDDLRQADGTIGYSPKLLHGQTGQGLNDYDAIFQILAKHHYQGWISIEDGMNGMEEMARSLAFLQLMIIKHYPRV